MMKIGIALVMFSPVPSPSKHIYAIQFTPVLGNRFVTHVYRPEQAIFLVVDHHVAWQIGKKGHNKGFHWEAIIAAVSSVAAGFGLVGMAA